MKNNNILRQMWRNLRKDTDVKLVNMWEPGWDLQQDISESDKTRNKKEPKIVSASSSEIYIQISSIWK